MQHVVNLARETLDFFKLYGIKITEVVAVIGISENSDELVRMDINSFLNLADKIYDRSFGTAMVNMSVRILGKDWWMERVEYDGAEYWDIRRIPNLSGIPAGKIQVFSQEETY